MDAEHFDDFVRRVLDDPSRRGVLRLGVSAIATSVSTALGVSLTDDAEAKKKKKKKKKKPLPPAPPPPPPASPPTSPPIPPPPCLKAQESCDTGTCCAGLVCGDNFCGVDETACCGNFNASCSELCDCCELCSFCGAGGTCECNGIVCGNVCTCGDCCNENDCPGIQVCDQGFCTCPSGISCGDSCCDPDDQVCKVLPGPAACQNGDCPTYDFCNDPDLYLCGEGCICVTSVTDENNCTTGEGFCLNCTTNEECVDEFGPGYFCVQGGTPRCGDACPDPDQNFCLIGGCSPLRAASRSDGLFGGIDLARKSASSAKTSPPTRDKAEHGGRKRRTKSGRR